jgi:hypothetical protein
MRTLHTNHIACGYSQDVNVGAIGRLHNSCEHLHAKPAQPYLDVQNFGHRFKESTKHHLMSRSLDDGINYFHKQIKGLSISESIIRELVRSCNSQKKQPSADNQRQLTGKFLWEALQTVSQETFKDHPLFGFGFESPLRLHLNLSGKRTTHLLPVVPLLGKPSYRSVGLTLGIDRAVDSKVCQESMLEILNLMLEVEKRKDELVHLSKEVRNRVPIVHKSRQGDNHRLPSFFKNLKFKILKQFKESIPRPLPEIPV